MYPNAVDPTAAGGGGSRIANLPSGFDASKVPDGATKCTTNADGITIFYNDSGAVVGNASGYKADGSVFTASADGTGNASGTADKSGSQGTSATAGTTSTSGATGAKGAGGNGNLGLFGYGFGNGSTGADFSQSWMNGGYQIDPNMFGSSSMGFFGGILSGFMGMGWMQNLFNGFLSSLNFNFNFGSTSTSTTSTEKHPGYTDKGDGKYEKGGVVYKEDANGNLLALGDDEKPTGGLPEGAAKVEGKENLYKAGEKYYTYNESTHSYLECNEGGRLTVPVGYETTSTNGVFKKGDKYYKYDGDKSDLVECNADGSAKSRSTTTTTTTATTKTTTSSSSGSSKTTTSEGTTSDASKKSNEQRISKNKELFDSHFRTANNIDNLSTIANAKWTKKLLTEVLDASDGKYNIKTKGNKITVKSSDGKSVRVFTFDSEGRLTRLQIGEDNLTTGNMAVTITYHSNGKVAKTSACDPGKSKLEVEYATNGNKSKETRSKGVQRDKSGFSWETTSVKNFHVTYGNGSGKLKERPKLEIPKFSSATPGYSVSNGNAKVETSKYIVADASEAKRRLNQLGLDANKMKGVVYYGYDKKNNVHYGLDKDGNALYMYKDNKWYTLRATGYDVIDYNPNK